MALHMLGVPMNFRKALWAFSFTPPVMFAPIISRITVIQMIWVGVVLVFPGLTSGLFSGMFSRDFLYSGEFPGEGGERGLFW